MKSIEGLIGAVEEERRLITRKRFLDLASKYGFTLPTVPEQEEKCASLFNKILHSTLKQAFAVAMLDVDKKKKRVRHVTRENMTPVKKRMRMYIWSQDDDEGEGDGEGGEKREKEEEEWKPCK